MRSLETAAQAGVVIVIALSGIIVTEAAQYGFPAIHNGELPLWGIKVGGELPLLNIPNPCSRQCCLQLNHLIRSLIREGRAHCTPLCLLG